ncbi:MAG: hypoxanthine phosphoribosyltransferase [Lachnospiraceae bacterium]|nr:hypoxanthine phosphoribosyltransferase [Lachnospiraceae bacterium]
MHITNEQNDIEYILFSEEQIRQRVKELGAEITELYKDSVPVVACILKGASIFYTDLCREIKGHMNMDFISVSSYGKAAQSSGVVKLIKDLDTNIEGRDLLIVEDIIDSGLTLKYLKELLYSRKPKSIRTVCLLDKHECHSEEIGCDLKGFPIENQFVVGYGLDYANYYRNLPYIGVLKKEVYSD